MYKLNIKKSINEKKIFEKGNLFSNLLFRII